MDNKVGLSFVVLIAITLSGMLYSLTYLDSGSTSIDSGVIVLKRYDPPYTGTAIGMVGRIAVPIFNDHGGEYRVDVEGKTSNGKYSIRTITVDEHYYNSVEVGDKWRYY